mmetsp:Transcript_3553/g.4091  ORF Transcript_3553/g.4091 Transcript_3553/m.4091 type:complete len:216 (+) Transcript_3553:411-1058(+)
MVFGRERGVARARGALGLAPRKAAHLTASSFAFRAIYFPWSRCRALIVFLGEELAPARHGQPSWAGSTSSLSKLFRRKRATIHRYHPIFTVLACWHSVRKVGSHKPSCSFHCLGFLGLSQLVALLSQVVALGPCCHACCRSSARCLSSCPGLRSKAARQAGRFGGSLVAWRLATCSGTCHGQGMHYCSQGSTARYCCCPSGECLKLWLRCVVEWM